MGNHSCFYFATESLYTSFTTIARLSILENNMTDDIDDKHNLKTEEAFISAMRHIEKDQESPCLICDHNCTVFQMFYCDIHTAWVRKMTKNG